MPVASPDDAAEASREITAETIDEYAALTGDDNPLHTDEAYAADGVFGGRVAHGALTAGVVSAAVADLPGDIVYVAQELDFENPVRPGETVTATATVVERLDGDEVRVQTVAETDERRVVSGTAVVLSLARAEQTEDADES